MKFNLIWESNPPELTEPQKSLLAREIVWVESMSEDASDLVAHMLLLDDTETGPSITMYGKKDNPHDLFLMYSKKTKWRVFTDETE